jgi:hypothetical protein
MVCVCKKNEERDNKILNLLKKAHSETKTESKEVTKVDNQ